MILQNYSKADGFFECLTPLANPELGRFFSWQGRFLSLLLFFEKLGIAPFALLLKFYKTFTGSLRLLLILAFLLFALFSSSSARRLFVEQAGLLAQDIADWVLWPVAVCVCLGRLLLAALIHPAFYFGSLYPIQ